MRKLVMFAATGGALLMLSLGTPAIAESSAVTADQSTAKSPIVASTTDISARRYYRGYRGGYYRPYYRSYYYGPRPYYGYGYYRPYRPYYAAPFPFFGFPFY